MAKKKQTYKPLPAPKKMPSIAGIKPAAASPASPSPVQPLDPNVVNQQIIGQRDVALSDLYSTWQQTNLDQQYGYGASGAANPYSDAAKLQTNFQRSVLGTTGSYASQGQFNSGAYGRAQDENARNYAIADDASRRAYNQASGQNQFSQLQAYANAGTGIDSAEFQAMLDALKGL